MKRLGVSLAETMIAMFLLAGVVLVLVSLLHSLLRYGRQVELQTLAALAADRRLEQIRQWARQKSGTTYQFENLVTAYGSVVSSDPDFADFRLTTTARWHPLDKPGTSLEQGQTDKQRLARSAVWVRVTVSWGNGRNLTASTLIGAPARRPDPVLTITQVNGGNPLAANAPAVFQAAARDVDGQTLPDLTYCWYVRPEGGNASIALELRNTSQARLTNRVRWPDGIFRPAPGPCRVEARAVYRGTELVGTSTPITMSP